MFAPDRTEEEITFLNFTASNISTVETASVRKSPSEISRYYLCSHFSYFLYVLTLTAKVVVTI